MIKSSLVYCCVAVAAIGTDIVTGDVNGFAMDGNGGFGAHRLWLADLYGFFVSSQSITRTNSSAAAAAAGTAGDTPFPILRFNLGTSVPRSLS